ncbi:hypothetical protein CCL21_06815 [Pseudomonas syringae]|uniref:hypothetical protein n=1 Tax=Pseudomonas syringae TaxID=317 RepID=UPI000BB5B03E|nr:hypothetical protein [Pseudomonas syringae]PBP71948.1 hypothetical protein CCL21_06815 [Pseudomonas syringae]
MTDLEKLLNSYDLLARAILKLQGTPLIEDPEILAQLKILAAALAEHHEQLSVLSELSAPVAKDIRRNRPSLRLVKR